MSIDWYYRKTKDLINTVFVPAGSNFAEKVTSNIGSLHNTGLEFSVNWRAIQQKDLRWELGYNITYNKNEIDELVASSGDDYKITYGGLVCLFIVLLFCVQLLRVQRYVAKAMICKLSS